MASSLVFSQSELLALAQAEVGFTRSGRNISAKGSPQSQALLNAQQFISLRFTRSQITHQQPPQLTAPQQIRQLTLDGKTYTTVTAWTQAWQKLATDLSAKKGTELTPGNQPVSKDHNVVTVNNLLLTSLVSSTNTVINSTAQSTVIVQGAQGTQGTQGIPGPQGQPGAQGIPGVSPLPIRGFEVDHDGDLIAIFDDSSVINAGNVIGPPSVFSIGSVTTAAQPNVTISGTPPNYILDFELQAGPGSGDVSTLSQYSDPVWITSLAASKVGLGNVTNESKATMFTSPTFTGLLTAQQSTEVYAVKPGTGGTGDYDFSTASIWLVNVDSVGQFALNFTNVPTTVNRTTVVTLILQQSTTPYGPSSLSIAGAAQSIRWTNGGVYPTFGSNRYEILSFTLIRLADASWAVLGSLSSYS